ncbi:hypothetical protein D3C81_2101880 [compost metagenome]
MHNRALISIRHTNIEQRPLCRVVHSMPHILTDCLQPHGCHILIPSTNIRVRHLQHRDVLVHTLLPVMVNRHPQHVVAKHQPVPRLLRTLAVKLGIANF